MSQVSTIGVGTTVRGSIRGEGDLEIHGRVEGSVVVTGEVIIFETALLKSDVRARRITVRGAVAGDVSADEAIVLEAGARVLGDLGAPQIGIRPGGMVRGNVSTGGPLPETKSVAAAPAAAGRARPAAPAARPAAAAPARAAASAPAARPVAARPAVLPAPAARPAAARPAPGPVARPEPAPSAPAVAARAPVEEPELDESEEIDDAEAIEGGPPPPVVPALRKGAKASLRRKGAR
jgi:cytoskeletal protein CcmA (bactofilin family)